jgi:predicted patatin/cPLA2 family phospholipase
MGELLLPRSVNGHHEGPVARHITETILSGEKDPNRKIGIVIVGGANAGVGPAGATRAAEQLGIIKSAGALYGISGGAFAAAYAATGQAQDAIKIYFTNLNTKRFYRPTRMLESVTSPFASPAVNVRYITDEVMKYEVPLDTDALSQSIIPVYGGAVDAITGESVDFDLTRQPSGQRVRDALRAGTFLYFTMA